MLAVPSGRNGNLLAPILRRPQSVFFFLFTAVAYGKGTYFAVNANYSSNDTYSRPDAQGKKHMYYVRVLTGIYTAGNASLIVPPPKNPQIPTDLYDTVTDNVRTPNLFVVFYDYQAYPEYLITFRKMPIL